MTPEVFLDVFRQALGLICLLVSATIVPSLIVGLLVSIFQAATSINEQTLSFLPRLLVTLAALALGGPWGLQMLMDFMVQMVNEIPEVIG